MRAVPSPLPDRAPMDPAAGFPLPHVERLTADALASAEAECQALRDRGADGAERARAETYRAELEAELFALRLRSGAVRPPEPMDAADLLPRVLEAPLYPFQQAGDVFFPSPSGPPVPGPLRAHVRPPWPSFDVHARRAVAVAVLASGDAVAYRLDYWKAKTKGRDLRDRSRAWFVLTADEASTFATLAAGSLAEALAFAADAFPEMPTAPEDASCLCSRLDSRDALAFAVDAYLFRFVATADGVNGLRRGGSPADDLRDSLSALNVDGEPLWSKTRRGATASKREAALRETKERAGRWLALNGPWIEGAESWAAPKSNG